MNSSAYWDISSAAPRACIAFIGSRMNVRFVGGAHVATLLSQRDAAMAGCCLRGKSTAGEISVDAQVAFKKILLRLKLYYILL